MIYYAPPLSLEALRELDAWHETRVADVVPSRERRLALLVSAPEWTAVEARFRAAFAACVEDGSHGNAAIQKARATRPAPTSHSDGRACGLGSDERRARLRLITNAAKAARRTT